MCYNVPTMAPFRWDRFKPRGLGPKLLGVILGLLAVLTVSSLWTVRHYFGQQLRHKAEREIRVGSRVLASILERSGAQLLERGQVLTELPSLQRALLKEPAQLEPLLLEVKAVRAANLLWATDAGGTVLACTGEYPPVGQPMAGHPLISQTLASKQPVLGFDQFGEAWWLLLVLPIRGEEADRLAGTVNLALLIGEAYLARLSELLGTEAGFVRQGSQLWSQGWPEKAREGLVSQIERVPAQSPQEIPLGQEGRFVWMAVPVMGDETPIQAGPTAVLGLRLDESVIRQSTRAIAWIALLTMGIGALFSAGAIRAVTRPLKLLVSDTQRIGKGDLAHRSQVGGTDEIGELAGSFNRMVERLEASHRELAQLNQTLEERVRERTRQLEETQAQLLHSEKLASVGQLAAGVAHELNNPLMVILGNTQLALRMLRKAPVPAGQAQMAELMELLQALDQESHRAKMIVANLLDFVRVKPTARTEVDLHTVLDESVKLVDHQASLQSVQVERSYLPGVPKVPADAGQLKQVFVNVILNAVQAMPRGGKLSLRTSASPNQVTAAIQDTGEGIPEERIPKIFDPFFTTKEVGKGTGLGLFIAYGIIQRHGGKIEVSSRVGQGTTLTIHLPRS